jgi:CheY-like chemotaxis protein
LGLGKERIAREWGSMTKKTQTDLATLCRGRSVLVIDDQLFSRTIVARLLKEMGVPNVVQAADATEALRVLVENERQFAAVICDFQMPVLTGLQFLRAVRTGFDGIRPDLPVIMLTGFSDSTLVGAALQLDVDAFVVKPASRNVLEERLVRALSTNGIVRRVSAYADVDVDNVSLAVMSGGGGAVEADAVLSPLERDEAAEIVSVPVNRLLPGAILAQSLCAASGDELLPVGLGLSQRLISRLRELAEMGVVPSEVTIRRT